MTRRDIPLSKGGRSNDSSSWRVLVYQAPDGEVEALRQVDMDIAPGEFCSVVGPSGCGKSMLLSVISGLE